MTNAPAKRAFKITFWPTVITTVMVTTASLLGIWQSQRLVWKENLISERLARRDAPPVPLSSLDNVLEMADLAFRRVAITGTLLHDREMTFLGRDSEGRAGYHIVTPLQTPDFPQQILINRGWVSMEERYQADRPRDPLPTDPQNITGLLRPGFAKSCLNLIFATECFTPDNDPSKNLWFWTDYPALSDHVGANLLPFVIEQDRANDLMQRPKGGQIPLDLPNNHLQYAITWFSMAIAGAVIWFLYHWRKPD